MGEILQMKGISKHFPGVMALDNVDLELNKGEILAILGENGAGKSTLLKILSGVYIPDKGEIVIDGKKVHFKKPADASGEGIRIIYQELNYYEDLSVAENIYVGNIPHKNPFSIDWKHMNEKAAEILKLLNLDIDPRTLMGRLSTAERQLVEIARAIAADLKILVMDEPTSALNNAEVNSLVQLMKDLAGQGISIIFISHRLEELFLVADRVMVMRDGKLVDSVEVKKTNQTELVRMMVGREIKDMYPKETIAKGNVVLEVRGLTNKKIKDISFSVSAGEILGMFGLMGAGRTEICRAIFGASKVERGEIKIHGKTVTIKKVADAKKAKIAYLPNDRKREGLILIQTVKENLSSSLIDEFTVFHGMIVDGKKVNANAAKWIKQLSIATPSVNTTVENLSGGNQQKVVVGKWIEREPDVIILNEPTRGIDVGAKVEVYRIMENLCKQGAAIVMVSSEQQEILSLTDRTVVICEGRKTGELTREEYTPEKLMELAIGGNTK
jgi:ABC-type sugar transport system ATPase subunit